MCGIAGSYAPLTDPDARRRVDEIIAELKRRGPDHTAVAEAAVGRHGRAILGHNRLSVIDLSVEANQPMWDHTHRYCIVYNGEIYNYLELRRELADLDHRFTTESDTEVILEAFKEWGSDGFNRLNGMFAFGLFETDGQRLWLVRDRFGVKPLYYATRNGEVLFSSTPGPLARTLSLGPNLAYVARGIHYLLYEDDGEIAPYEGVRAVPSGCFVTANHDGGDDVRLRTTRYYNFEARTAELADSMSSAPRGELIDELRALLESSVNFRLRADVPVAIALSGGLDSSSIAAIVGSKHERVTAFSFSSPDVASSEGPLAARAVKSADIDVDYVWPTISERIEAFWATLRAQDAPFTEMSMVAQYMVCQAAHRSNFKVLLGGQGGDEVLMGYRKFQLMLVIDAVRRTDLRDVAIFASGLVPMLAAEAPKAAMYWRQRKRYTSGDGLSSQLQLPSPAPLDLRPDGISVRGRQVLDVIRLSLPTLLRYEDRNSMDNSLETRLPFLDYRLAEFAVALPSTLKVHRGYGKWALRRAMRGRIPTEIERARYKRGFDTAQKSWMTTGLGASIRSSLRSRRAVLSDYLHARADLDSVFSDRRLGDDPRAIAEATTLLWLSEGA
jgi:asparagine synthase (glutamine-hydrolysing)